ncbi:MAG: hypothetical protein AW08_03433 [Candidatus Accumulibacter adjunctus]|uniref:Uncharacterized protein n=1 Tax=Candidatus Accumulibacter adjunctus TaxID=1454001 RepID=A0A011MRE2_9PROT|nr:MAG: hypothetical protein AW08_03433 [Candidatus Accumulibacter adjunctus]
MAPADVGLGVLELLLLGLPLAHFGLVEARLQHRHRFGAVAVLRAVVLALDDDVARQVRDADRRIGLVDVLAAGTRGAVGVDAQVGRVDLDGEGIVDLGVGRHRAEAGMAAGVRVEGRLADQAMDARLRAQHAVGVVAGNPDARRLDAGDLAFGLLEHLDGVTLAFGVAQVHAQQHRRPVLRLGAAGAGLDVEEAVERVGRVVEHAPELERGDLLLDAVDVGEDRLQRVVVAFIAGHGEQLAGVTQAIGDAVQRQHDIFQRALLAAEFLRALGVVPDLRVLQFARDGP